MVAGSTRPAPGGCAGRRVGTGQNVERGLRGRFAGWTFLILMQYTSIKNPHFELFLSLPLTARARSCAEHNLPAPGYTYLVVRFPMPADVLDRRFSRISLLVGGTANGHRISSADSASTPPWISQPHRVLRSFACYHHLRASGPVRSLYSIAAPAAHMGFIFYRWMPLPPRALSANRCATCLYWLSPGSGSATLERSHSCRGSFHRMDFSGLRTRLDYCCARFAPGSPVGRFALHTLRLPPGFLALHAGPPTAFTAPTRRTLRLPTYLLVAWFCAYRSAFVTCTTAWISLPSACVLSYARCYPACADFGRTFYTTRRYVPSHFFCATTVGHRLYGFTACTTLLRCAFVLDCTTTTVHRSTTPLPRVVRASHALRSYAVLGSPHFCVRCVDTYRH